MWSRVEIVGSLSGVGQLGKAALCDDSLGPDMAIAVSF